MKLRIFTLFIASIMFVSGLQAQTNKNKADMESYYTNYAKTTSRNQNTARERNKTSYFDSGAQFTIGFTMPFPKDVKDVGRFGSRAEVGFITSGQCSFYTGIAYQFSGLSEEVAGIKTYIREHDIMLPEQFSLRLDAGFPIQFKVGPFIGFNVYSVADVKGYGKESLTKGAKFGDIFLCGLQANMQISYFSIGYTLERNPIYSKKLDTHLLTIGLTF